MSIQANQIQKWIANSVHSKQIQPDVVKCYIDFKSVQFRWIQCSSLSAETVLTEVASHQFDVISIQFDRIQLH